LKSGKRIGGDTTGCGDNFAGGVVASVISQLQESTLPLDISEAVAWGVVSGGITTFYMGGMLRENARGEKRGIFDKYYELYRKQVGLDS
jgi:sugar/nucleoside kinase (ribokinase family)